jgi:hypothetical protein
MEAALTPQDLTHDELAGVDWQISSHSGDTSGNCVEVGRLGDGRVAVRHSHDPDGEVLVYTRDQWAAFTADIRAGEFDAA